MSITAQFGQVTTDVPVTIYAFPNTSAPVVGTFMPGIVMVNAGSMPDASGVQWIKLQEAVIDFGTPDTAIVNDIGWVSQSEASAAGGSIGQPSEPFTPAGPPTPFAGQDFVTAISTAFKSLGNAIPTLGTGVIAIALVAGYLLLRGPSSPTVILRR